MPWDASVDVHPNPSDLWDGPRFVDEEEEEEDEEYREGGNNAFKHNAFGN